MKQLAIAVLFLLAATSTFAQTTTTDCTVSGTGDSASVRCTSTDDAAQQKAIADAQAAQQKSNDEMFAHMGNAVGNVILARINKGIRKYCDQHQGEPWNWQVNGQKLSGTCPGDITQNAGLKQYCATHPGEYWANKTSAGVVLHSGTCPGEISQSAAQKWLIASLRKTITESGAVGFAEIVGDKIIAHDERASAVRLHMTVQSPDFLEKASQAGVATVVYTNDADVNLTYDLKSNQVVKATQEPAAQTAQK